MLTPNRFAGAPTSGTVELEICGSDDPEGTWRLQPVVTEWWDEQGVEHDTEILGTPSTFEVGTIVPLPCPDCEIEASLQLRIVTIDGRRRARATLVTHYGDERLRIRGVRVMFTRKRAAGEAFIADVLTDRRGVATLSGSPRLGSLVRARSSRGWIQYNADHRLGLPRAASPWVRVR